MVTSTKKTTAKTGSRRVAAKKAAPARKGTVKPAAAKKAAPARKGTVKPAAAKKAAPARKGTTAKSAVAKKAAPARQGTTAKSAVAKKAAPARKGTVKAAAAKKAAPARKGTTAKPAAAKKAAPARKGTTAKSAAAKKAAPGRKGTTAKSAAAKKAAPGRKKPTAKPAAAKKAAPARRQPGTMPVPESIEELKGDYMNPSWIAYFRTHLIGLKQELMEEVERTVHHMQDDTTNFPDPNDRATQEEESALELRIRDRERRLIKKIDESLVTLEAGDYGYCETCGEEIGIRRLEARPTATLCVDCKTLDEERT